MKAVVWTRYGSPDGLELREVARPAPKDNEVLIKVFACSATTPDCELRSSRRTGLFWLPMRLYIGIRRPTRLTILGQEVAGVVDGIGSAVKKYKVGDQVFAWTGLRLGGNAEYVCLSDTATMAIKPPNVTFAEAAVAPLGGLEAWQYLSGTVQSGDSVLFAGAGGTIGTFAVQLAKHFGASVTAVDRTEKLQMLVAIGADHVIDFTQEDFTKNGQLYDLIFDAPGVSTFSQCRGSLKPNGRYVSANPGMAEQLRSMWNVVRGRKKAVADYAGRMTDNLNALAEVMAAGHVRSVIDRSYPLVQTAEAHRYIETGLKRGNVVILVEHDTR